MHDCLPYKAIIVKQENKTQEYNPNFSKATEPDYSFMKGKTQRQSSQSPHLFYLTLETP